MTISNLKDPLVQTCTELFPMFGLEHRFMCELPENSLNSGEKVNVIAGLTNGLKGNIVLGLTKEAAFEIVSKMMGGTQISDLDMIAKSALSEFMVMLCGNTVGKIGVKEIIDVSPPTLVTGDNVFLMISKAPSKKLFFKLGETKFNIAYCLE
ncbi:MAG: hypothetical protein A2Y25_03115 [Candidatus Melainabacteria bacterium GWF2_37_15]|nr:MAG: hypothetical protein A2Y25_03115 [Candidatus Melainabacteria bacterium GWF2_37_15]